MNGRPTLSVVMPVHNGGAHLPRSVAALLESHLPKDEWELIIADDGSTDGSAEWAESHADRVIRVPGGPRGPASARNLAAHEARGSLLVFVDSDVCVHPDALSKFRRAFEADEGIGAAFGAYDDAPAEGDFLSQYRNLFHRYVHVQGTGDAATFWAGCGAVRRELFLELDGFDTRRFERPQIEDVELGYRIRDRGWRIVLDPEIQGTHLKRWSFPGIVKTDLLDRGIPWMRLLLGGGGSSRPQTLNVSRLEKVKAGLMALGVVTLFAGLLLWDAGLAAAASVPMAAIVAMNGKLYRWFAGRRGWAFALGVVPMNLLYYLLNGVSVLAALALHFSRPSLLRKS